VAISYAPWQSYPWKNELELQADRAVQHGAEVLDDDFRGDHAPHAMLERAMVLAAFCVRRMIEKKLVTDTFAAEARNIRAFPALSGSNFRPPYHGTSGGQIFRSYSFAEPQSLPLRPAEVANEIIHSSQLMVVGGESVADGFLIASDRNLSRRLLHLSFAEFREYAQSVLDNRVFYSADAWDPETGKVTSTRT
jgi:hypothetical protein